MTTVNLRPEVSKKPRYHHGNLRVALIDAGFELARVGGPEAIGLREVTRRAGVSHNAAYRHFPDREALVQAVGERCMTELAELMQRLIADVDPDDHSAPAASARLAQTGIAYVQFALGEPGLFRTGFAAAGHTISTASVDPGDDAQRSPLDILRAQLDAMVTSGAMSAKRRPNAEFAAWSAVHGFSMLLLEGPLRELSVDVRDAALDRMLSIFQRGLQG